MRYQDLNKVLARFSCVSDKMAKCFLLSRQTCQDLTNLDEILVDLTDSKQEHKFSERSSQNSVDLVTFHSSNMIFFKKYSHNCN